MIHNIKSKKRLILCLLIVASLLLWGFFSQFYPWIVEKITLVQLPPIESSIFLAPIALIMIVSFTGWSLHNKIWLGPFYALHHYMMIKRIRKHIKDARFEDEHEYNNDMKKIPKIKIIFHDNHKRKSGKVLIRNSVKFDKKLEDMRIDSALKGYVSERKYLSKDRDWYIYEFYSIELQKQIEIERKKDLITWANKTADDYALRLDERTNVSFHHMGLVGQTGSGKSYLIQMMCEQVLSKEANHELFIIDPKRTDVFHMAKRNTDDTKIADRTNAIALIKDFHKQMEVRQNQLQNYLVSNPNKTYKDAKWPAFILLIDEFAALKESWKTLPKAERDQVDSILYDVAFMGRQLGFFLWITTQQMNAQTIPTAVREQLALKIALGDSDEQTYRTLFSSSVDIPPVQFNIGQGLFSYPNKASVDNPKLISIPYCSFLDGDN